MLAERAEGEMLWVMQDQGSTRAMLNSAGQVVGRHDALPFGDTTGEGNEVGPQAPADETTGLHGWWNTIRQQYAGLERDVATGCEPHFGKFIDLNMLVMTGDLERTEEEFRRLLEASGFRLVRVINTDSPISIVEAVPD